MSGIIQVTGRQIAAARALIGLDQAGLADSANVSVQTLRRMEAAEGPPGGYPNNIAAVRAALEKAGVEFIAENGGGPGVRLKKTAKGIEEISQQIAALEDTISSISVPPEPSPKAALNTMKKAIAENDLTKLKIARKRIKEKGVSK